jgi:hypothetical protein
MPRGGRRIGAGRPVGSRRPKSVDGVAAVRELEKVSEAAQVFLSTNGHSGEFVGDAVDFLVNCYRNPLLPVALRIHCAVAVAPFERPKLNAVAMFKKDMTSDAGFGKMLHELETRLALHPPEKRTQLIEALRNGDDDASTTMLMGKDQDAG